MGTDAEVTDQRPYVVGFVSSPNPHTPMHVRTMEALDQVRTVHFCGLEDEDLGAVVAGSSKVGSTTGNLEELLARSDLDALIVSTSNDRCPGIVEAAVDAGLPVLFEKPGAINAADLRRIAELGRSKGVTLGAMYTWRKNPMILEVRRARLDGALGRVMTAESRMVTSQVRYRDPSYWLFSKERAGSGILSWLACHHIDMLCFMLDDRVVEVTAMLGNQNREEITVEDTACVVLRFGSGVLGTVHAGYHISGSRPGYEGASGDMYLALRGTEGHVTMPLSERNGFTLYSIAPGWASGGARGRSFDPPASPAYAGASGAEFVSSFLEAGRAGRPAPCPIEDAVHILDVVEAAVESSATGRAVRVGGA